MRKTQIVAMILVFVGVLALIYGHFSWTKETHGAKIGPLKLEVKEKETVTVPIWVGVGAVAAGVILLLARKRR